MHPGELEGETVMVDDLPPPPYSAYEEIEDDPLAASVPEVPVAPAMSVAPAMPIPVVPAMPVLPIRPGGPEMKVAVMGATGTGKSSFIKSITQDEGIVIGHSLPSETDKITLSRTFDVSIEGGCLTFVDMPGFDDSRGLAGRMSDSDILRQIGAFLQKEYEEKQKLAGIVYTHRISEPTVGWTSLRNIRMFRQLCGTQSMRNVVILTTMWDQLGDIREGVGREHELRTAPGIFKDLIDAGARLVRSGHGLRGVEFPEPEHIVSNLILHSNPVWTKMQEELAFRKSVGETSAGSELDIQIQELIVHQMKQIRELGAAASVERSGEGKRRLEHNRWQLEQEVQRREEERRVLMQHFEAARAIEAMRLAEAEEKHRQLMTWERNRKKKKKVLSVLGGVAVLAFL
ncbi:hypothetical protein JAAARDRAFT_80899 [Jaapia argillacea MUCL 33604]|uniref:G domain-containing protein n=1 Tax=Jaapia argillacea MUCL 33604 TaxID=933084 RepID=A0A067PE57_9AGAM|nr:hypothetical protein JAAARDRAFT_80899 [Jaapia argillacea MUCL 33604]